MGYVVIRSSCLSCFKHTGKSRQNTAKRLVVFYKTCLDCLSEETVKHLNFKQKIVLFSRIRAKTNVTLQWHFRIPLLI